MHLKRQLAVRQARARLAYVYRRTPCLRDLVLFELECLLKGLCALYLERHREELNVMLFVCLYFGVELASSWPRQQ